MTPLMKLEIRAADIRKRLGEIGGLSPDELTDEVRQELDALRKEHGDNESQQTAIKLSGGHSEYVEKPAENRELDELRANVEFGKYVAAAIAGRPVLVGPEAEYNQEYNIPDSHFPLDLLAGSFKSQDEERAKRDGDASTSQASWLDRVFDNTGAMRLGISFRDVAPGVASFPVTTAGGSGAQRGRQEAVTESTYTFAISELKPTRAAVHAIYSIEDASRLPGMSDAIERDMRAGMAEDIDRVIFRGDNGANENSADVAGLEDLAITEQTLSQSNKVKPAETVQAFLHFVDGKYATSLDGMRVVATEGANTLWHGTIANAAASNETIGQFLMRSGLSWSVRGGIETNTGNGNFGAFIGLPNGLEGAGIAAVWRAGQMVVDPYSGAKTGEVQLTLNYLWNFGLMRTANFGRIKFVT